MDGKGPGGAGGGETGERGYSDNTGSYVSGGSQTAGGKPYDVYYNSDGCQGTFGQGGSGANYAGQNGNGGAGGGGWYGGGGNWYYENNRGKSQGGKAIYSGGGGGSGYIGGVGNGTMQSGVRTGEGYAKIKYINSDTRLSSCFIKAGIGKRSNGNDLKPFDYVTTNGNVHGIFRINGQNGGTFTGWTLDSAVTTIDFRWKYDVQSTWNSASFKATRSWLNDNNVKYNTPQTIEVYQKGHVGEAKYLQDVIHLQYAYTDSEYDDVYWNWQCEHTSGTSELYNG